MVSWVSTSKELLGVIGKGVLVEKERFPHTHC
jgi:hypothetical protein